MKHIHRRDFLKKSLGALGTLTLSQYISPQFLMAQSLADSQGKNLILINLAGGCDGLSLLPYKGGAIAAGLRTIRPTIGFQDSGILDAHTISGASDQIGLHASLAPIQAIIQSSGHIVQKYGIKKNVERSHDTCSKIMDSGLSQIKSVEQGFLARFADTMNYRLFQYWGFMNAPAYGSFTTHNATSIVANDLTKFNYPGISGENTVGNQFINEVKRSLVEEEIPQDALGTQYTNSGVTMHDAVLKVRDDINTQVVGTNAAGNYSTSGIGVYLRDTAKVLKTKVNSPSLGLQDKSMTFYMTHGGFDNHDNLKTAFSSVGSALSSNLAVFVEDLKTLGIWNNTVIVLFSEFGRTCRENGTVGATTVGTDHGWGSNTIVLGGSVAPGVSGDYPTLTELNASTNALVPTTDYRDIFSEVFNWMGTDARGIFTEEGYTPSQVGFMI